MPDQGVIGEDNEFGATRTVAALARGLCDVYDKAREEGGFVSESEGELPHSMREALYRLSRLCLEEGWRDLGVSVHEVMDLASRPLGEWGPPSLVQSEDFQNLLLIHSVEPGQRMPTKECRELAGSDRKLTEEKRFDDLMERLRSNGASHERTTQIYTQLREFVVRNPVVRELDLVAFASSITLALGEFINTAYRKIPSGALHDGEMRLCGRCGSLLWPSADKHYPDGMCMLPACRIDPRDLPPRKCSQKPEEWRVASPDVLGYWVSPGLEEIRVYDALRAAGLDVALYPELDRVDISVELDNAVIVIDVKDYKDPRCLGSKLKQSLGGMSNYGDSYQGKKVEKIIAIPSIHITRDKHYRSIAKQSAGGNGKLVKFMSTTAVIKHVKRRAA